MDVDENALLEQAKQQDEHAFLKLIKRYAYIIVSIIRQYIARISGYEEEDIKQEITLAAYKVLPQFRGNDVAFQCWLRRSTKGLCLNLLDKQKRHEMVSLETLSLEILNHSLSPPAFSSPDAEFRCAEISDSVQQAIHGLSEHYRKVVIMKDLYGMRYREIAEVLGIDEGTVKSRLNRARTILRTSLRHLK